MCFSKHVFYIFLISCCFIVTPLKAQQTGAISGTVLNQNHKALPGVNVSISGTRQGTATNREGKFILSNVSAGTYHLLFSYVGFKRKVVTVTVNAGQTQHLTITLTPTALKLQGIRVTALSPDLQFTSRVDRSDVKQVNPRDSGELLRSVSGVDAVRRGPVGLDPVVRGLRETEVGTYLNGTRIFPGGPARMDSPLSHLDPSAVRSIKVVKGPYALTKGAGNMSAVIVNTRPLSSLRQPFGGTLTSGYDSNFNQFEEAASLHGRSNKVGYWLHGAWRKGQDYQSGSGTTIPAGFLSRELRGKVGYQTSSNSRLSISLGYQNQRNIDYPGRLLNADYFRTYNGALHWNWNPNGSIFESVNASVYRNEVHHGMENDGKPTARPMEGRKPPFALDIGVKAHAYVTGGKLSATIQSGDNWDWKIGGDVYSANRDAVRKVDKKSNGKNLFTDLMWPDATITDGGLYTKISHRFSDKLHVSGTVRLDFVGAKTDTISQFFKKNVAADMDARETNLNGAVTLSYNFIPHWTVGISGGSVVRTADATERYSDRTPASKAQTSAEFVGNPALAPERNTQGDLWLKAGYRRFQFSVNGFVRRMSNYITIRPTDLPKELPLSPNTVYQYDNGSARFYGFDASVSYRFISQLTAQAGINYLYGQDTKLNEPALGISPFSFDGGLRYESSRFPLYIEGTIHAAGEQDRVATIKGETPTEGYVTEDLELGATIYNGLSIQGGVKNLADKQYVNHLNAKNPFTGQLIPEPGRVFHLDLQYNF